jgi:hypothetical protein
VRTFIVRVARICAPCFPDGGACGDADADADCDGDDERD